MRGLKETDLASADRRCDRSSRRYRLGPTRPSGTRSLTCTHRLQLARGTHQAEGPETAPASPQRRQELGLLNSPVTKSLSDHPISGAITTTSMAIWPSTVAINTSASVSSV